MLIESTRLTERDREQWAIWEATDALNARRLGARLVERANAAVAAVHAFGTSLGYVGVSWGKDSVTLAHILRDTGMPFVWVRVDGVENPDCPLVRDAFLSRHDIDYHEIRATPGARRTSARGFAEAARRFGDRHVSGVRAQESRERALRTARWGVATARTCAPLARWSATDIFTYLHMHDLPIHPAYAQSGGGRWHRDRIRVGALGGERGTGHGRREWEYAYYPSQMARFARP